MRLLALLLLAACTRSNRDLVKDLERAARANRDPAADRVLTEGRRSVPLRSAPRSLTLPLGNQRLPTVRGKVNGVELPLMLDTGASLVSLSGPAAERAALYLPPGRAVRAISPGFDAAYRLGVFRTLTLGEASFGRGAVTVPLEESRRGAYGIVGCSVLGHFVVTFDFRAGQVRLEPPPDAGAATGTAAHGPFFVDVRIHGRRYSLLVDSGAARVFLEPWAARELGLIGERDVARRQEKSGTFRAASVTRVRLADVEVAGRVFDGVPGGVVKTFPDRAGDGARPAGLLGLVCFGKLAWTLDFRRKTVRIAD